MIYVIQLVYVKEGQEKIFFEFEDHVLPIIPKYNGKLLLRLRPTSEEIVTSNIEPPFEIHFVEFASEVDFENFKLDKEREKFLHLKNQSVKAVTMIKGSRL